MIAFAAVLLALASPSPPASPAPCGWVSFIPIAPPRYTNGTAYERIRASVHFADRVESAVIPYPWIYPDGEANDPWSDTNMRKPDFVVTFQMPPPDFDRAQLPPLIAFIIAHTDAGGTSTLASCRPAATSRTGFASWASAIVRIRETRAIDPGAQLDVTPFSTWQDESGGAIRVNQCVSFTNRSERTVQRVHFTFRYRTASGVEVSSNALDVAGPYAPHAGTPSVAAAAQPNLGLCVAILEAAAPPPPERRVVEAVTSVGRVDYSDGTSWTLSSP